MSAESILISWRPPTQPNGVISQYTVYTKADNTEEPISAKVPPNLLTYEAQGLDKQRRYEFWVTASTNIGEGQASKIVTSAPNIRGFYILLHNCFYSFSSMKWILNMLFTWSILPQIDLTATLTILHSFFHVICCRASPKNTVHEVLDFWKFFWGQYHIQ